MSIPEYRPPPALPQRWRTSVAAGAWTVAGMALLVLGLLTRRPDVGVLGVPLVLTVVWNWLHRPDRSGTASLRVGGQLAEPGEIVGRLTLSPAPSVASMHVRVAAPGHRTSEVLVAARQQRELRLTMSTVRTGQHTVFSTDCLEAGADHLVRHTPFSVRPVTVMVLPAAKPLRQLPLPFRLQGLTGAHNSRRAGDGGDLHDINLFQPGDRLRRIDWRVTARRGQTPAAAGPGSARLTDLYVRRTFATADATVMLVLDSRDEVGPDISNWSGATEVRQDQATSLDVAREAAASLARRFLDGGDRVGLEDLGRMRRPVPPAGGRQQLRRLVHHLALAQPEGEPKPRRRAPRLPSGALIIVFSTFLDDDVARLAWLWRQSGHRVIAVDVLPRLEGGSLPPRLHTAYRIIRMERGDRLRALAGTGVELVHWEGDPDGNGSTENVQVSLMALARRRADRR
ncbi:DUF58 domain-containing protein [Microlunatus panaciterrae]|uniref:Uncharacterized protein (DUF58 family) n=1 Tax=Microlunatus panaciterrae TaxID=400768 RepID=A0ABS2RNG9_9ACTN|nr:uncharacterized protein (DUF58 family) [Microlunatus panaciterrae]